jgi:hypothetical protein
VFQNRAAIREVAVQSLESELQNVIAPTLSEKTNSCCWVRATATRFKKLAEQEKENNNNISLQKLKGSFEKI